ncbi:MAG: hypothetical protein H6Q72_555 [Firmicutes bacterium]|nr:hypothetical protein [Bacillota bacterium]
MAAAPTPPTKPTPPTPPTLTPAGSQNSAEQQPAAVQIPAVGSSGTNQPVSPEVSEAVKKVEEIRKAFEGMPTKPKAAEQEKPAETGDKAKPNTSQPWPAATSNTQNVVSSQTAVPPQPVVSKNKPSITTFLPFFVGVVVLVAVVLVGMRLFKVKSAQTGQTATTSEYVENNPSETKQDSTKIIIAPPDTAPKSERNFEAKV